MSNFKVIVRRNGTYGATYEHHIVHAPTLREAVELATTVATISDTADATLVSVREMYGLYPQEFLDADEDTMLDVLKTIADDPVISQEIDDYAERYEHYNNDPNYNEMVQDTFDLLRRLPGFINIDCTILGYPDDDFIMVEHYTRNVGDLYLSTGMALKRLSTNRYPSGPQGFASLVCGIRNTVVGLL